MSGERVFNVFVYFNNGVAHEYGVRHHRVRGGDQAKMAALAEAVATDHPLAKRFRLPRTFTPGEWAAQQRLGVDLGLFEEGIAHYRAGAEPLYCLTSIVDGVPRAEVKTHLGPHQGDQVGEGMPGTMPDWLVVYTEGNKFRFDELINDDYFAAIRLLFNARRIGGVLTVQAVQTVPSVRAKLLRLCHHTSPASPREVRNPDAAAPPGARARTHGSEAVGNRHPRRARGRR